MARKRFLLRLFALLSIPLSISLRAEEVCLPSCDARDARMLSLSGAGFGLLDASRLSLYVAAPATATELGFGIFDGDLGGFWDNPTGSPFHVFVSLYADPQQTGSTATLLGRWSEAAFEDNAWVDQSVPATAACRAANGACIGRLDFALLGQDPYALTSFKVRTASPGELLLPSQPLALLPAMFSMADVAVLYPSYPSLEETTYDGSWQLFWVLTQRLDQLRIWDGDTDFGASDCQYLDSNDPDTPDAPFLPRWAVNAQPEGVAEGDLVACGRATGSPPDDDLGQPLYLRSPAIQYRVVAPDGRSFLNADPSGNLEWELFAVPFSLAQGGDPKAGALPPGVYRLEVSGWDLANRVGFYLPSLVGVLESGEPALPQLLAIRR